MNLLLPYLKKNYVIGSYLGRIGLNIILSKENPFDPPYLLENGSKRKMSVDGT